MTWEPSPVHGSCTGSLIVHLVDFTAAGCTLDDEPDGCAGIELRHEGDPTDCVREWGGCNPMRPTQEGRPLSLDR
jgi:hypothetical protein